MAPVLTSQKSLLIMVSAATLVVVIIAIHGLILISTPANKDDDTPRTIIVKRGTNFGQITSELLAKGVIHRDKGFRLAGKIVGAERKVHAGEYELMASMSPAKIVNELVEGNVKRYNVTFPEGYDIRTMAKTIEEAGLNLGKEFSEFTLSTNSPAKFALPGPTLEGYLFPDTYDLTRGITAPELAAQMVTRFKTIYDKEKQTGSSGIKLSLKEVTTLASIIEKETGDVKEMATISAVFHNRMKRGIALQSDPTVIYGVLSSTGEFDGNLTRAHLKTDTPYNTYTRAGLPPGPIASPGKEAIHAALNPADADYLYFVSKNDGMHHFSKTLREHNQAVDKYQKRRR